MEKKLIYFSTLLIAFTIVSCSVVTGIFNAGVTTGIILVIVFILLIVFLVSRFRGRN